MHEYFLQIPLNYNQRLNPYNFYFFFLKKILVF
jgi:hypothetical protein